MSHQDNASETGVMGTNESSGAAPSEEGGGHDDGHGRGRQRSAYSALTAHPGRRAELVAALDPLLESASSETGMVDYVLHPSDDDPDTVWFFARFADQEALDEHQRRETAFGDLMKPLLAVLARPPETVYGTVTWSDGRGDDGTRRVRTAS